MQEVERGGEQWKRKRRGREDLKDTHTRKPIEEG
jgi:hypothetical protein